MGIAVGLAGDGTQAETAGLVIAGAFQAPVINHQHFSVTHFEKQLAVISIDQRLANNGLRPVAVECATAKENLVCGVKMVHLGSFVGSFAP